MRFSTSRDGFCDVSSKSSCLALTDLGQSGKLSGTLEARFPETGWRFVTPCPLYASIANTAQRQLHFSRAPGSTFSLAHFHNAARQLQSATQPLELRPVLWLAEPERLERQCRDARWRASWQH